MDIKLFHDIMKIVYKINPDTAEGLAVKELEGVEEYIDKRWRSAAANFPPNLYYEGPYRYTPEEESNLMLKRYDGKTYYDLAPTDTFIVKYKFRYSDPYSMKDSTFHCNIRLPFVTKGNRMRINGTTYTIMPVATDPVFYATNQDCFLSLNKRSIKLYFFTYTFVCNDLIYNAPVIWSNLYTDRGDGKKSKKKRNNIVYADANSKKGKLENIPLSIYLFAKYGLTKTFELFGVEVKVLLEKDIESLPHTWAVCRSSVGLNAIARGTGSKKVEKNELVLALNTRELTYELKCLISSFYYISDCYSNRIFPDFIDSDRMWTILLGASLQANTVDKDGIIYEKTKRHISIVESYIDLVSKDDLEEIGICVDNIYELFTYLIKNASQAMLNSNPTTMYNKKIRVLPKLMSEVVESINRFVFQLKGISPNQLSATTIKDALKDNINMDQVIKDVSNRREITIVDSATDCLIYEHTSKMLLQSQMNKNANKNIVSNTNDKNIDVSVCEVGSFNNHSKKEPTGRGTINTHLKFKKNGEPERDEVLQPLLNEVAILIKKE